jgi:hypothetical protein
MQHGAATPVQTLDITGHRIWFTSTLYWQILKPSAFPTYRTPYVFELEVHLGLAHDGSRTRATCIESDPRVVISNTRFHHQVIGMSNPISHAISEQLNSFCDALQICLPGRVEFRVCRLTDPETGWISASARIVRPFLTLRESRLVLTNAVEPFELDLFTTLCLDSATVTLYCRLVSLDMRSDDTRGWPGRSRTQCRIALRSTKPSTTCSSAIAQPRATAVRSAFPDDLPPRAVG